MEHELRCNNIPCRRTLTGAEGSAIVTTCSHIFCVNCAETLFNEKRLCPACETSLPDNDDIIYTSLSPTQGYKTTVLAGLTPSVVHDICGRALGFWTYQVSQEVAFQAMVLKDAQERASLMDKQLNNIVREANSELASMQEKIRDYQRDVEQLKRKNKELAEINKDNAKEYTKLKAQYDKMQGRNVISGFGGTSKTAQVKKLNTDALDTKLQQSGPVGPPIIGATPARPFHPSGASSAFRGQRLSLPLNLQHQQHAHDPALLAAADHSAIAQHGAPASVDSGRASSRASGSSSKGMREVSGGSRVVPHQDQHLPQQQPVMVARQSSSIGQGARSTRAGSIPPQMSQSQSQPPAPQVFKVPSSVTGQRLTGSKPSQNGNARLVGGQFRFQSGRV